MSSWDILGGGDGNNDDEEEVEYVGVIEEDVHVQEPRRSPRRNVRRVAPQQAPTDQQFYPVYQQNVRHQNGVVGAPNRDEEDLVSYVDMPYGKQLGLTPEAIERLQKTPMSNLNGQMSQRIEPGTYVMYGPNRANDMSGMGTDGPDWLPDLFGAVGRIGGNITEAVAEGQQHRREMDLARFEIDMARDAASEASAYAFNEAQLATSVELARIEAGAEELEVLREQAEAAAALRSQVSAAPVVASGTSPVVWILVAVLGLGAVGGIIYAVSKKD